MRCQKIVTQEYTDLDAKNILIPGERTIEDERYNQKQLLQGKASVYKKCPEDKPFFD